ncbi:MAG TPA: polyprenyl synthetase family protein [Candidatus Avilachnospira avistercoris]|nr:polyprenyl synthetase family protein [Candidatus Avilachnospira avistercoris]
MSDFMEELRLRTERINEDLSTFLPEEEGPQRTILTACNYSVENGGKRLRPIFMECTYELFGGREREKLLPLMAAIEMIHSSSLVHDDLPCMDNDELRRGKPSTWAKFGVDMGTLCGDALMIYAFETAFKSKLEPDILSRAVRLLAEKSGIYGMIGGQTVDVELTGSIPDPDTLRFIYEKKTAALIEAALMMGALASGADEKGVSLMEEAGRDIGMAFQIRDDILDVTSTAEKLGKSVHADDRNAKVTWVTFYGLEQAEEDVRSFTERAVSAVSLISQQSFLEELIRSLVDRSF